MKNLPLYFLRSPPSLRLPVSAANSFLAHLSYFITLSLIGYGSLKLTKTRTSAAPNDLNIFFTSVSAATVSSMSVVEMEVFSNFQLLIITTLMFLGGEVFLSAVSFQLAHHNQQTNHDIPHTVEFENESATVDELSISKSSFKVLGRIIIGYLLATNIGGACMIIIYLIMVPHARHVLEIKGINFITFSIFSTVSTFTNCGFIPTNENMIVFKKNSGLLIILAAEVLLGGCLYPVGLRLVIMAAAKVTGKKGWRYILKNDSAMGYSHLLSGVRCRFLAATAAGFIILQFIIFCSLEWNNSDGIWDGMNPYEKVVGSFFQVINSRHTGESVVDISLISPAILVVFLVMMYLPPYTTFLPLRTKEKASIADGNDKRQHLVKYLTFSQLSYLAIFITLICITERDKLKNDPLNFSVLNIAVEVISAYGNVGFSTGYSCKRQVVADSTCRDAWYGFAGRWSAKGKLILILVMFFGRLKSFSRHGGKAWKLS
ncbi:Sodium transporter HKT1, partial [Cucurbita argyrosperma subsp. argyrosperma]